MKSAIITGGTKGIGKDIAMQLLKMHYSIVVTYANDDKAANIAKNDFSQIANNFKVLKVNQSSSKEVTDFTMYIKQHYKNINCIVCNAGATIRKNIIEITNQEWENVFQISLNSHFYIIRDLYSIIPPNSRIIFIGSILGIYPHATSLPYGVAKSSIHALAKNLVKEFEGSGTTVNTIVPGFVETEWQKNKPIEIRNSIYNKTAIKRFANVNEITSACLLCINNDFINGATIEVSGGYSFK